MDGGIVLLLLFAAIAAWLLNRVAKLLRIGLSTKSYVIMTVVVVLGILLLYGGAQA